MNRELKQLLKSIQSLPYGRNSDRADYTLVPIEQIGSCSTKHAYIKSVADKNNWENVKLILCIYMMNSNNTAGVSSVLEKYQLKEIPEAHTFLEIDGKAVDVTGLADSKSSFLDTLIIKEEIQPDQIGGYKINFHKSFIADWAQTSRYSADDIWSIREECIQALEQNA